MRSRPVPGRIFALTRAANRLERRAENEAIDRRRREPVIRVWEGILVMPLVGDIPEERSTNLIIKALGAIPESGAKILILDTTGVTHRGTVSALSALSPSPALRAAPRTPSTGRLPAFILRPERAAHPPDRNTCGAPIYLHHAGRP
jgi:hypothetical protein